MGECSDVRMVPGPLVCGYSREVRCVMRRLQLKRGSAPHTARSVCRVYTVGHAVGVEFRMRWVTVMLMLEDGRAKVWRGLMLATERSGHQLLGLTSTKRRKWTDPAVYGRVVARRRGRGVMVVVVVDGTGVGRPGIR